MIDFNNDALDLMAAALEPLVSEHVTIDVLPEGYINGMLRLAEVTPDGPFIEVSEINFDDLGPNGFRATGPTHRLHASEQCRRIQVYR